MLGSIRQERGRHIEGGQGRGQCPILSLHWSLIRVSSEELYWHWMLWSPALRRALWEREPWDPSSSIASFLPPLVCLYTVSPPFCLPPITTHNETFQASPGVFVHWKRSKYRRQLKLKNWTMKLFLAFSVQDYIIFASCCKCKASSVAHFIKLVSI